jgi:hypothetical protein
VRAEPKPRRRRFVGQQSPLGFAAILLDVLCRSSAVFAFEEPRVRNNRLCCGDWDAAPTRDPADGMIGNATVLIGKPVKEIGRLVSLLRMV